MFYLGVDGGGTKTAFALCSRKGQILASCVTGTSHPDQIGLDQVRETLNEGLQAVCDTAGIDRNQIAYSIWGLPGYGENLDHVRIQDEMVGELLDTPNYKCVNDVEVGWAGSLACRPGLHMVAGTGSIGFGKDPLGRIARCGGWGEFMGDEGSAHWLGRKLLQLFAKQADHRLEKTVSYSIVRKHFDLKRDLDLVPLITAENERDAIAQLARIAYQAAQAGDPHVIGLYREAALELSQTYQGLAKQLDFPPITPIPASYSGGVFNAGDFILKPLQSQLDLVNIALQKPKLTPILGACLYALENGAVQWDDQTVATLKEGNL
ncbi:MAG TPA: ATPase [Firmicutes bacterium]|nr:ATPase [Bacillota bacterium]